jgi:hypothetical protein
LVAVVVGVGERRGGLGLAAGCDDPPVGPVPVPVEVADALGFEVGGLVDVGEALPDADVDRDGEVDAGGDADGVGVEVVPTLQPGRLIVLVSRLTCPLRARTLPDREALVCSVIEVRARMFPTKFVPVPRVAELPTCQNTLQACAPLINPTVLLEAVISVEPAWKMNTAWGSPCALRVTVPVSAIPAASL